MKGYNMCDISTLTNLDSFNNIVLYWGKISWSGIKIEQEKENRNEEKRILDKSEGKGESGKLRKWATIFLNATEEYQRKKEW